MYSSNGTKRPLRKLDLVICVQAFNLNLYLPTTYLSLYQKGSYYMGIKQFNALPLNLKQLYKEVKRFKLQLKEFLNCRSFYTLDEYFEYSSWKD
jgi:hypothetical protein